MSQRLDTITNTATHGGALAALFGWATLNDLILIGGFLIALVSAGVNYWHKRRMVALRERELDILEGQK